VVGNYFLYFPQIAANYFPRAFESVYGKSIMFIIEKKRHDAQYCDGMFEVLCVSDDPAIIKYYVDKGVCSTPSKVIKNLHHCALVYYV
jgi:hypothetical protein